MFKTSYGTAKVEGVLMVEAGVRFHLQPEGVSFRS
jgi:hypothetical protein